jgi:pantoate--beta-alanine ligase
VDGETLAPLPAAAEGGRLMAAGVVGTTRLIDNMAL